jgi:hypothetical protein
MNRKFVITTTLAFLCLSFSFGLIGCSEPDSGYYSPTTTLDRKLVNHLEVTLIELGDKHDYFVASCSYSSASGVGMVHATGCRKCSLANPTK